MRIFPLGSLMISAAGGVWADGVIAPQHGTQWKRNIFTINDISVF